MAVSRQEQEAASVSANVMALEGRVHEQRNRKAAALRHNSCVRMAFTIMPLFVMETDVDVDNEPPL